LQAVIFIGLCIGGGYESFKEVKKRVDQLKKEEEKEDNEEDNEENKANKENTQ
jgi:predicted DNA repair protein MutK